VLKLLINWTGLPREPFRRAKDSIDAKMAANCGIAVTELRPWHYHDPFFQEAPVISAISLDAVYAKLDILKLCKELLCRHRPAS